MNTVDFFIIVFGAIVGSFLNMLIHRLPLGEDIVFKPSYCPKCKNKIRWYHNLPILGFLMLAGKCAYCKQAIPIRYFLVEVLAALGAYFILPRDMSFLAVWIGFVFYGAFCLFICHFFIDLAHKLLLDSLNLVLLALFLSYSVVYHPWPFWLGGAVIGYGMTRAVSWIYEKRKGQVGLGMGDVKLYGVLGVILGPMGISYNIFLSCLLGALIGLALIGLKKVKRNDPIPFGPFIIAVAVFQIYLPKYYYQLISLLGFSS